MWRLPLMVNVWIYFIERGRTDQEQYEMQSRAIFVEITRAKNKKTITNN